MRLLGAIIVCLAALGGCVGTASGTPEGPADFAISYQRSGGFTGSIESLVVRPGLRAVATNSGTGIRHEKVSFPISAEKVRDLQAGLHRAHLGSIESKPEHGYCADCYVYEIAYRGHRVRLVEPDVSPRLSDFIGELEAVISSHTIPPNA